MRDDYSLNLEKVTDKTWDNTDVCRDHLLDINIL
jgi:hypothetical protein